MVSSKAATVADYLAELPEDRRAQIERLRDLINDALPDGYAERMNWGMITWEVPLELSGPTYNKQPLAYAALAAQKNSNSLYLNCAYASKERTERLKSAFAAAGKKLYLIPYFIAAHPGTSDEDMMNLALWLKRNGFKADQVQTYLPSPMALATAMYHSDRNPLRPIRREGSETVFSAKGLKQRRLHKAFLRYHDPENWPVLRDALKAMGRSDLIGPGEHQLVPAWQTTGGVGKADKPKPGKTFYTQQAGKGRRAPVKGGKPGGRAR